MSIRAGTFGLALVVSLSALGCAHQYIPGTEIEASTENQTVFEMLQKLRAAIEARDGGAILTMVSPRYFEDMGTPDPTDDYGFEALRDTVLPESLAITKEMYLTLEIQEISVDGDKAHADVRYSSRARIDLPAGTLWDSHKEFNRIELEREEGAWRIVAGL